MRLLLIFAICGLLQVQAQDCPANMHWDECSTNCEPTCQSKRDNSFCAAVCSEGCICDETYILNDQNVCILESTCPQDPTQEPETEAPTEPDPPATQAPTEPPVVVTEAPTEPPPVVTEAPTEPPAVVTEAPTEPPAVVTQAPTEPPTEATQPAVTPTEKKKCKV